MKKIALFLLLATFFIQWAIPAKMIWDQEQLYKTGTTYKIRTIPVDPNDPFRGKYITLNYDINTYATAEVSDIDLENLSKKAYVQIAEDKDGFAKVINLSQIPPDTKDYLTTTIRSFSKKDQQYIFRLDYPFQTFFMEETKAPKAEKLYWEALRNSSKNTYGLVNINRGDAVLIDVQVDGISIKDLVEE